MGRSLIQAVIFDMDGVITDTMPGHYRVWRKIFHDEGIPVTRYQVYEREGQKGIESLREIFALHQIPFDEGYGRLLLRKKELLFNQSVKTRFIPGSRSLIKALKKAGLRLALVTGTSRDEVARILPEELLACFEVQITGTDVHNGKPHPEPYLKALKGLGVSSSRALVIENAPFGIRSAKAAGLKCLAVATSLPASYLSAADQVFGSMGDIKTHLHCGGVL